MTHQDFENFDPDLAEAFDHDREGTHEAVQDEFPELGAEVVKKTPKARKVKKVQQEWWAYTQEERKEIKSKIQDFQELPRNGLPSFQSHLRRRRLQRPSRPRRPRR